MMDLEHFQQTYGELTAVQQKIARRLCDGWLDRQILIELGLTAASYRYSLDKMLRETGAITPVRLGYWMGKSGVTTVAGPPLGGS